MTPDRASPSPRSGPPLGRLLLVWALLSLLLAALPPPDPASGPWKPPMRAPSPPQVLVLQPDGADGNDTSIMERTPAWNYGDDAALWVGADPLNGTMTRSLLSFNLSALPANATIIDATLELFQFEGGDGSVQIRRASAPWTEGTGDHAWLRVPLTVRETAGVRRTSEPVGVSLSFPPGAVADPAYDLRTLLGGVEVPSQTYGSLDVRGRVSSAEIFFGASMAPWETKAFNITAVTTDSPVPWYRTKAMGPTPLWTSPPVGTGASGVTVVDLDGDGLLDVVYGTSDGYVVARTGQNTSLWATPLAATRSVPYSPQVVDIDSDGQMDVIVMTNDFSVVRLNATGGVVWNTPIPSTTQPLSTPTLIDVDGNGVLDVLLGLRGDHVEAYNGTDGTSMVGYVVGGWCYTPSVFDADGDGRGEIYFGSDDGLVHAFPTSGPELWANSPPGISFVEDSLAVGDVNGDGHPEIVTGDDKTGGPEFALYVSNGSIAWSVPLPGLREGGQTLADIDGNGLLEVIVGVSTGPMYALNGQTGLTIWTYPGGITQAVAPAIVDLTNDGSPEIVYLDADGGVVRVLDAAGALIYSWNVTANDPGYRGLSQKAMATPAVVDINGDGAMEVIVPTGSGVMAFPTGGLSRDWRTYGYNWNHTHRAYDGSSPDGAPLLQVTRGAVEFQPAIGASWDYRDGVVPWVAPGGDFQGQEAASRGAYGWVPWNITSLVDDWYKGTFPNVGIFLWASPGALNSHKFFSSDAPNSSARPRLTITYTYPIINSFPRVLGRIPDLVVAEDTPPLSRDLAPYAADDDSPLTELRWNITGYDLRKVLITGLNVPGNHVLSFYPEKDAWGSMPVTYWLTDLQGHTARQDAWINITPVNDAPEFNPPSTLIVRYNSTYTFDFGPYIADVDNPPSQLTLTSNDLVHTTVSGFNLSFLYPQSHLGQWQFVGLVVSDGQLSVGKVVAVKVTSDDPPVLVRLLPDVTLMEGQTLAGVFDLDDYFTDPNSDALFYSFGYTHLNITIHASHSVDIQAASHWTGIEQVTFRGVDTQGAMAEDTILVTVIPVDDPPVLGPVPDLRVRFDANYTFNLEPYISDPDTPLDRINASTSSAYVTVFGHVLTLLYPAALNGTVQPLTIFISDGTTTVWRTIRVTVGGEWPPTLKAKLPDRSFLEDAVMQNAYDLTAFFNDTDSSTLYWSSGNVSVLVSIDPLGNVTLSAKRDWFGVEAVTFRAMDSFGGLAEDTVWLTVLPVDDPPYILAVPTFYMNTTTAYLLLTPYLGDVDNNVSELTLSSADPAATVIGQGILFNYSADTVAQVEVTVSDGLLTNRTTITVVVTLPKASGGGVFPPYLLWLPLPVVVAAVAIFLVYRWRQVEWALLATNSGLLVSSVFRRDPTALDTDLITGMLTAIMNFAKASFSDEKNRELDSLTLGDRKVTVVRGDRAYLAVVYKGRTAGSLPHKMKGVLAHIETRYPAALSAIVDSADLEDIPVLLKRFVDRAWWPFFSIENGTLGGPAGGAKRA